MSPCVRHLCCRLCHTVRVLYDWDECSQHYSAYSLENEGALKVIENSMLSILALTPARHVNTVSLCKSFTWCKPELRSQLYIVPAGSKFDKSPHLEAGVNGEGSDRTQEFSARDFGLIPMWDHYSDSVKFFFRAAFFSSLQIGSHVDLKWLFCGA